MSRPIAFTAADVAGRVVPLAVVRRRSDGHSALLADPPALAGTRSLARAVEEANARGVALRTRSPAEVAAIDAALPALTVPRLSALFAAHRSTGADALLDLIAHADTLPSPEGPTIDRSVDVVLIGRVTASLARACLAAWRAPGGGRYRVRPLVWRPPAGQSAIVFLGGSGHATDAVAIGDLPGPVATFAALAAEAFGPEDDARALGSVSAWLSTPPERGGAGLCGAQWEAAASAARERLAIAFTRGEGGRSGLADGGALELSLSRDAGAFAFEIALVAAGGPVARAVFPLARFEPEVWRAAAPPEGNTVASFTETHGLGWTLTRHVDARHVWPAVAAGELGELVDLDPAVLAAAEAAT